MNTSYILNVVQQIMARMYDSHTTLSQLINEAKRVATLRQDIINLWWLNLEIIPSERKGWMAEYNESIRYKFPKDNFFEIAKRYRDIWMEERAISIYNTDGSIQKKDMVFPEPIGAIEARVEQIKLHQASLPKTDGMHTLDKYYQEHENSKIQNILNLHLGEYMKILTRIKNRVYDFLVASESSLLAGNELSSYFERNKIFVEEELIKLSDNFSLQFQDLHARMQEGNTESLAQALLLIRRILKTFADNVYPPIDGKVVCSDGKERNLSDEKYISRLLQFVYSLNESKSTNELFDSSLSNLDNRLNAIYLKSCKGVHNNVNPFEANQCVIQMYVLLGDIIRLKHHSLNVIVKTCSDSLFTILPKNCPMTIAKLHTFPHSHNRMKFYQLHSVLLFPDFAADTFLRLLYLL